jgi:hypothetical protein
VATEIRLQLGDPSRPRALLYKAGKEAANSLDLEARTFRLFRPDRGEDRPPLNVFESLMDWLFRGLEVSFVGTGKERALRFLRPSPILTNLSKGRVVWLDATPNKELMTWFAGTLGMDCVETNIPQPIQQITQIVDRLWTGGQLDNHPEAVGLLDFAEDNNALIIRKKARAQEGEAYFGRDERALNAYKDAPFTVLEGHHAMSDEQARQPESMAILGENGKEYSTRCLILSQRTSEGITTAQPFCKQSLVTATRTNQSMFSVEAQSNTTGSLTL